MIGQATVIATAKTMALKPDRAAMPVTPRKALAATKSPASASPFWVVVMRWPAAKNSLADCVRRAAHQVMASVRATKMRKKIIAFCAPELLMTASQHQHRCDWPAPHKRWRG